MPTSGTNVVQYGGWKSPLSSALVVQGSVKFQEMHCDPTQEGVVFWSELHPEEDGNTIIFSKSLESNVVKRWTPKGFSSQSRVHEYGGGSFIVHSGVLYFVNKSDQRYYSQQSSSDVPTPITPDVKGYRYADGNYSPELKKIVCVCEDHTVLQLEGAKEPQNSIVIIDPTTKDSKVLVSGADFYASPQVSPDGKQLLWMEWNHPNMPWDDTSIYVASLKGDEIDVSTLMKIAGRDGINFHHPRWNPDGSIFYISDETNWWNIYSFRNGTSRNVCPKEIEFGFPQWQLGRSHFDIHPKEFNKITAKYEKNVVIIDTKSGEMRQIAVDGCSASDIIFCPSGDKVFAIAHSPTAPSTIVTIDLDKGFVTAIAKPFSLPVDPGYLTTPGRISFATNGGASMAYGNYYPPKNKDYKGLSGELPPLLVKVHGGPTSQASLALDLTKQYFTSRGFAILDIDHRGSTGYGKKYREQLYSKWGVLDIEDCCNGALYLAKEMKLVNPNGIFIDGGSAGGYTTLACLTFRDVFKAGASHFGVSNMELLAQETHKFESRYLDRLIAPYPEEKQIYLERSPIHHTNQLRVPVAFFHGALDKVVPPNQAEMMFNAVKAKGLPCSYILFPDEYHGFVKSKNKQRALDGEFYFFCKILGITPADSGIEIPIENL